MNGEQTIQITEPSRQALIDRIIRLQEDNAKKAEKLDFFEEHSRTLVEELQKKTRVIQNYILHESSGAMGSNERDRYKVSCHLQILLFLSAKYSAPLTVCCFLYTSISKAGEMQ